MRNDGDSKNNDSFAHSFIVQKQTSIAVMFKKTNILLLGVVSCLFIMSCNNDEPKHKKSKVVEKPVIVEKPTVSPVPPTDKSAETGEKKNPPAAAASPRANANAPSLPVKISAKPDFDTQQWSEIVRLDSSVQIDIRYATDSNFVKQKMYDCGRCFLRPDAAAAIAKAHQLLKKQGFGGLKMFDCYRPRPFQQRLWDKVPDDRFVTPPAKGSQHSRGAAVDLTIVDKNGQELDMGTPYDFFGKEGFPDYKPVKKEEQEHWAKYKVRENRDLLRATMDSVGFKPIRTEWWHFDWKNKGAGAVLSDWVWKCPE
jgi:zinc D-Ala-D-Ala dipeptidase